MSKNNNGFKNVGMIILICLNFLSCAQSSNKNEKVLSQNDSINNVKTERHVNIPFTHVFIAIPNGYKLTKNQSQIFKDDFTGINLMELDGGNFYTNAKKVTEQNFENQGFEIEEFIEFKLNNYPAIFFLATSPDKMNKSYQLVTGDSTFSVMLMGYTRPNDTKSLKEIKEMMLSFVYDKQLQIDYEKIAPFTYDKKATDFRLAQATSSFYTYTINGDEIENKKGAPFIIVGTIPSQGLSAKSISLNMKNQTQGQGLDLTLKDDSFEKINGYDAYEATYYGKQGVLDFEFYTLTLIKGEYAVVIQARTNDNFKKYNEEIKNFAYSIRIK